MPDWASVMLTIASGLLGGGLVAKWLEVAHLREQERRATLDKAAGAFAERITGALDAVRYAVEAGRSAGKHVDDAEHFVGETANVLAAVELHFDDKVGEAARAARQELRAAITALRVDHREEARAASERAEEQRIEFSRLARAAIGRRTHRSRRGWWPW